MVGRNARRIASLATASILLFGVVVTHPTIVSANSSPQTVLQLNPTVDPGGNCQTGLSSATGLGGAPQEQHPTVDLSKYQNQSVQLRFYFTTVDPLYNGFEGWYVDHVNVSDSLTQGGSDYTYNPSDWTPVSDYGQAPGWHQTGRRTDVFGDQPWWYGNEATGTYQITPGSGCADTAPNAGTLTSKPISLGTNPLLNFDTLWQIESVNPSQFDLMQVQVIPTGYAPNPNGYQWQNFGDGAVPYDNMAGDYPASNTTYFWGGHTIEGSAFFANLYQPYFASGVCYGMAASSTYFANDSPLKPLDIYNLFPTPTTPMPFSFDGQNNVPNQRLVERYHSRQLAEYGVNAAGAAYVAAGQAGNAGVWSAVANTTAGGSPIVIALVPSASVLRNNPSRWWQMFNDGHVVVGYATSTDSLGNKVISVYDPNAPGDMSANITIDGSGGMRLQSNGQVSFGGGVIGGHDWGQPQEWQATPLPDATYLDNSVASSGGVSIDNKHWIMDLAQIPIPFVLGAAPATIPAHPVFIGTQTGGGAGAPRAQLLAPGQSFATTIATQLAHATTGEFENNHVVLAEETDPGAPGTSHGITIDPTATAVSLSAATSQQQYRITLGADYLPNYGRELVVSGVTLSPLTTVSLATDAATASFSLSASGPDQQVSATISEAAQAGSTANINLVIPGGGASASVSVYNWNDPAHSLIYETVTRGSGTQVIILQDNRTQRSALIDHLYQGLQSSATQIVDHGIANSISSKVAASQARADVGDGKTATNILNAMEHDVSAQSGKKIDPALAATLTAKAEQIKTFLTLGG